MTDRSYLIIDIAGTILTAEDKKLLQHPKVSGIILFARNYHSLAQLKNLTSEIHALRDPPLLITVDHEGGRVQRFRQEFTLLPAMRKSGYLYETNPEAAIKQAEHIGETMGNELKSAGIDCSFAPVLDIDNNLSEVIGDRSFHHDPHIISILAGSLLRGMHKTGLIAVGKHFPGHGYVKADSHTTLPVDIRSFEEIAQRDLLPFEHLIKAGIEGLMPAHVLYKNCDAHPAGFSSFWLQDILRKKLNFKGTIFSDDLMMEGAASAGSIIARVHKARSAGCDKVLICNHRDAAIEVIYDKNNDTDHFQTCRTTLR
jgi:beta-N-acetylhexosaminidase